MSSSRSEHPREEAASRQSEDTNAHQNNLTGVEAMLGHEDPMQGVELQIRGHTQRPSPATYPLSLDQRIRVGDQFRQAKAKLEAELQSIEQSPTVGSHTGQPGCERCARKKKQTTDAYYEYYVSSDPDAWSWNLPYYRQEMSKKLGNSDGYSLKEVHAFFQSALREHMKQDLCTPRPTDSEKSQSLRAMTAEMFETDRPTSEILTEYFSACQRNESDPDVLAFLSALNESRTKEERAQIYIRYYCSPSWDDSTQQKNFKAKYARMFEQLVPHDEVMAAMRKEAAEAQSSKRESLQRQLSTLQMARSAHQKAKAKKEEKEQRMMMDREPSPKMIQCSLDGCGNEINLLADEILECAICRWLDRKGGERGRYVYCSRRHAKEDFEEHDLHEHACFNAENCIYYPQPGPPGDTGAAGICEDCEGEMFFSLFCCQDCYENTLTQHRQVYHNQRRIGSRADQLDLFQSSRDEEIMD